MDAKVNVNELIKARSNGLRGTLVESMADDLTGALHPDDAQISKFHGFYEQDDRDVRQDRADRYLEPHYSFMLRARLPGGVCTPHQWLLIDEISRNLGNGSIRLTTRQTFQYHGILKKHLKPLIQGLNQALIDSIGGCGDVNRNVMCNPNPVQSDLHGEVYDWATRISEHLLPRTRAYHEIWLDEEPMQEADNGEPVYHDTFLPRKFKTAIAVPPHNDVDVYTNDLGFIALADSHGRLEGFNVVAGGGMGTTHGDKTTFPRLASDLGFVRPEDTIAVAEAVVKTQRDCGDRISRKHARLKYTIEQMGIDAFRTQVEAIAGVGFDPARTVSFTDQGDRYGWIQGNDGRWHLTLYIENGRVLDKAPVSTMGGLRAIAEIHQGDFRITPSQNLIIAGVLDNQKNRINELADRHGLLPDQYSLLRRQSIACVALPTCPQAMAEAERYFPAFLNRVEGLMAEHGIADDSLVMRMTGCPNGCARPFVAEIGLVGKGPGRYNLMLGGDGKGQRLNKLFRENLDEAALLEILDELFVRYTSERNYAERFGDFVIRSGIVKAVLDPAEDYHD